MIDHRPMENPSYPPKGSLINSGGDLDLGWSASIFKSVMSSNQSTKVERELREAQNEIRALRAQQEESLREVESNLERRWAGCLSDANKRVATLEARIARDEHDVPGPSPPPTQPTIGNCASGCDGQGQTAQLRAQLTQLELEKQDLADSLNSQLVDAQRQLHQLHARRHELDEKLRVSHRLRGQVSVDLEALNRQLVSSRSTMGEAVDTLHQLVERDLLEELPCVEQMLAGVCSNLERCRRQLTEQEMQIQDLQMKHGDSAAGSSSEGSPRWMAGSGKSQLTQRSLTRGSLDASRIASRWMHEDAANGLNENEGSSPASLKEERISATHVQQQQQEQLLHQQQLQQQQQQQHHMGGAPMQFKEPQEECTCAIM